LAAFLGSLGQDRRNLLVHLCLRREKIRFIAQGCQRVRAQAHGKALLFRNSYVALPREKTMSSRTGISDRMVLILLGGPLVLVVGSLIVAGFYKVREGFDTAT
jgi:hypothetical protein